MPQFGSIGAHSISIDPLALAEMTLSPASTGGAAMAASAAIARNIGRGGAPFEDVFNPSR